MQTTSSSSSDALLAQLEATHTASAQVRNLSDAQKQALLERLAANVAFATEVILEANGKDLRRMDPSDPKYDRLLLDVSRLASLAQSIRDVSALPDPSGVTLLERELPNGLHLRKVAVPLGVVGVIYESRPNVTLDVTALCLRSGNAAVLRGGADAFETNTVLTRIIQTTLEQEGLSRDCVTLLPTGRELVKTLLTATRFVDMLIPRGSDSLIRFVRENSLIPVIETGAGVCHTYVHAAANLGKACAIVVNAKVSRPSVCNALDTVLVDEGAAPGLLERLDPEFRKWKVEVFADPVSYAILSRMAYPYLKEAKPEDFGREFLDYKCSVKVVRNLEEALGHIRQYSSRHSEAIISEDAQVCRRFLESVDAAAVYANASTRFTDGGVFGLGAEIGISTQKLHARGPFALEKLVTEKWIVQGEGHVRW
ncbi:MAG: glutamate-5-semialdehyde dehydrogenase [Haliscomenobacter sp.]|nr:glutamate-5-semialdehyde dehydrogenase [Haliscomenobacter sp.]